MGILIFIIIVVAIVCGGILSAMSNSEQKKVAREKVESRYKNLEGFTPTKKIQGVDGLSVFAIDDKNEKIAYLTDSTKKIVDYSSIISVELIEDNTTIASRSLGRTVGGALVGGALAGGAGSVVGGLSGNQNMKKKVSSVVVKITLRDINSPTLIIDCFNSIAMCAGEKSVKPDSIWGNTCYKPGLKFAQDITDSVKVIIDKVEKESQPTVIHDIPATSVADEIMKLADLKEKGILSEDEFNAQKAKLLGN